MPPIDDPPGGDPPCWAHLLTEGPGSGGSDLLPGFAADLPAIARAAAGPGAAWSLRSDDLNATLLAFADGDGVAAHANADLDVLLVGVAGEGIVEIDGRPVPLGPGVVVLVPKGARRATRAVGGRFAYLSCHRRRPGLWPGAGPG